MGFFNLLPQRFELVDLGLTAFPRAGTAIAAPGISISGLFGGVLNAFRSSVRRLFFPINPAEPVFLHH
jgi:hypothetical protein